MNRHVAFAFFAGVLSLAVTMVSLPASAGEAAKTTGDPVADLENYVKKLDAKRGKTRRGSGTGGRAGSGKRAPMTQFPPGALQPNGKGDPHRQLGPDKLIKVALRHLAEGRTSEALMTLNQGIQRHPASSRLLGIRGTIHLQKGQIARALQDLEAAVKAAPEDVLLRVNRAQAYRKLNRPEPALTDLDKAIALEPDFVAARFNRGALLLNQGKFKLAKADFEHCVSLKPHMAASRFNLAITLDGLGERDEAIAEMERFIKMSKRADWTKVARQQLDAWRKRREGAGPKTTPKAGAQEKAETGSGGGTTTPPKDQ